MVSKNRTNPPPALPFLPILTVEVEDESEMKGNEQGNEKGSVSFQVPFFLGGGNTSSKLFGTVQYIR
jgi:hypothetical protein